MPEKWKPKTQNEKDIVWLLKRSRDLLYCNFLTLDDQEEVTIELDEVDILVKDIDKELARIDIEDVTLVQ